MKVRDLIKMDVDIDVYDDVCEELAICFCGPLALTEAGKRKFRDVLDYEITFVNGFSGLTNVIVRINDDEDWKVKLQKAVEFFNAAAGYCSVDDYDAWFESVSE